MSRKAEHLMMLTLAESRMLAQLAKADLRTENEEMRWLIQREWHQRRDRSGTGALLSEDGAALPDDLDKGQVE